MPTGWRLSRAAASTDEWSSRRSSRPWDAAAGSVGSSDGRSCIVVIRTFLSWSLELEITGQWPWQKRKAPAAEATE
ncbi:hypothetical protein E4U02_03235 [Microbacterium paludicola]|uniref:Uncharacterized protein n=1 Tax=Microbacterium paludicola TaxID=300019 RepID=A0A4Y9FZE8_9MICO|nr:hypothetical protein E4U02_03235 [Microbacterium paludicola]